MEEVITKDSVGNVLNDGDSVIVTKTLPVKGSSLKLKKGMAIKNIRLTGDPDEIDVRVGKASIGLKTMYVKKK